LPAIQPILSLSANTAAKPILSIHRPNAILTADRRQLAILSCPLRDTWGRAAPFLDLGGAAWR